MSRGTEIVAAIAQRPFVSGDNEFATVKPIAVIADGRLELVRAGDYPNRDLCWWLVRGITPQREIMPGRPLVAYVQEAEGFDPTGPDKDKFQLAWDSVKLGGVRNLIEVVVAPSMLDPRELVNRRDVLSMDHPPTSMVLVRVGDKVYGPLKTDYEHRARQFRITLERPSSSELASVLDWGKVRSDAGFLRVDDVTLAADGQAVNRSA